MKKPIISAIFAAAAIASQALVTSQAVKIDGVTNAWHPVLSPDGTTLLFSTDDHTGLKALSLSTGAVTVIDTEAAAGFNPVFSTDGKKVFYRTSQLNDKLMERDVRSFNTATGTSERMQAPGRADVNMQAEAGNADYAYADYKNIVFSINGEQRTISPLADAHSYLWASLSPDGSKLLFTEPFKGVFVANADGTDARRIAPRGDFASWAGRDIVVFVVSHDDGYMITDSKLVAIDLRDDLQAEITGADTLVSSVTAAADGTVVYSTLDGALYKLTLK